MIIFSENIENSIADFLNSSNFDSVFILTDSNTSKHCLPLLESSSHAIQSIQIAAGENAKNLDSAQYIWKELIQKKASRNSLLINLGGGMITDIGGFCAATFQRGISFVNIPTSLLAMVDASVGGKNGVDFLGYKNYIGSFALPQAVFISAEFLKTLPENELLNGWAEVCKHAIITQNKLWDICKEPIPAKENIAKWKTIIEENVRVKSGITEEDPKENGERKKLNFGHTIGHAIESVALANNKPMLHGMCVAAGIFMESHIAYTMQILNEQNLHAIQSLINKNFPSIGISSDDFGAMLTYMYADKKNHSGKILMALPKSVGEISTDIAVSEDTIIDAFKIYIGNGTQTHG